MIRRCFPAASRAVATTPAVAAPAARHHQAQAWRDRALVVAAAALLTACGSPENGKGGKPGGKGDDKPATVISAAVVSQPFAQAVTGIATLRAQESVLVTARTGGRVSAVLFSEGSRVSAGTPLVRLEDDEERAAYNAAKANAELAAGKLARIDDLLARGMASQDERDIQAQVLKEAQARAELARVQLEIRTLRAPFAGVLGFRQVSPGALVQPGDAIVSLDAIDTLRADFPVPEALANVVRAGNAVEGRAAAVPSRVFAGRVTLLGTRVDSTTRTVTVQAQIDNRERLLKPGMLMTMAMRARERDALFVPEAALVPENARQFVWRIRDGSATRVEITPGTRRDGQVEVLAGLVAGERVAIAGQGNLRDGKRVEEAPAAAAVVPAAAERAP
jgi:membrane fusion protein (multidrug efflux system)